MKRRLDRLFSHPVTYYLVALTFFVMMSWKFNVFIYMKFHFSLLRILLLSVVEGMTILSVYWIFGRRGRWTAVVAMGLMSFWYLANAMYSKAFQKIIDFKIALSPSSYTSLVKDGISGAWHPGCWVYIACFAITLIVFIIWHPQIMSRSLKTSQRITWIAAIAVAWVGAFVYRNVELRHLLRFLDTDLTAKEALMVQFGRVDKFKNPFVLYAFSSVSLLGDGEALHIPLSIFRAFNNPYRKLDDEGRRTIDEFLDESAAIRSCQTVMVQNKGKNLIIILAESLNADLIGRSIGDKEVMPFLSRIASDSTSIVALKVLTQIGRGKSADGQLMYNAGVMPPFEGAAAVSFARNRYNGLADLVGFKTSIDLFTSRVRSWNHDLTSQGYGYKILKTYLDEIPPTDASMKADVDRGMFEGFLAQVDTLSQPFIAQLCTINTHHPFKYVSDKNSDWIPDNIDLNETDRRYCVSFRNFDRQVEQLITQLESKGLMENTIVVIVGDHVVDCNGEFKGELSQSHFVPFIAIGVGKGRRINNIVGQIDVFPTILDIMGVESGRWRGVGLSMFNPMCVGAISMEGAAVDIPTPELENFRRRAAIVSDLMITTDYFAKHYEGN